MWGRGRNHRFDRMLSIRVDLGVLRQLFSAMHHLLGNAINRTHGLIGSLKVSCGHLLAPDVIADVHVDGIRASFHAQRRL